MAITDAMQRELARVARAANRRLERASEASGPRLIIIFADIIPGKARAVLYSNRAALKPKENTGPGWLSLKLL